MAKIIYAVAGQGFGHSSRSHLIGQHLIDQGHEVIFAGSNQSYRYLSKYFDGKVNEISGLHFVYDDGNLDTLNTIKENIVNYPASHTKNIEIFKNVFEQFDPDLVISDFEPFTAWWAWFNGIPYISIDHEHVLTMCKLDHDSKHLWPRLAANFVTKYYYAGAKNYIILNFFKSELTNKKAILAAPVVRKQVTEKKPTRGEHIIFYSTDSTYKGKLLEILKKFPKQKFTAYGFNIEETVNNCTFKKTSTDDFLNDLASSKGVIATAGFSLISECLYFRKKMLLLPVKGQYEQMLNAKYMEKMGMGIASSTLDQKSLAGFMDIVDKPLPNHEKILWPDNEAFFAKIDEVINNITAEKAVLV